MKIETNSVWDSHRHRPNVYFTVKPENETERALLRSLYSLKGKVVMFTDGECMVDFFPAGEPR